MKRCNIVCFFFSSRRRHTRWNCDWSSDVCSSDLALEPARNARTGRQAASDRNIAVAGYERCDQREERIEIGGEIDVHVGHDRGVTFEPGMANRPPASLLA